MHLLLEGELVLCELLPAHACDGALMQCASWAPPRSCVQVQPDLSEPLLLQVCDGASIIHPRICCREGSLLCGPLLLHACNSALLQAYAA